MPSDLRNAVRGVVFDAPTSNELRVALFPRDAYAAMLAEAAPPVWKMVWRPALALLVIAVSVTVMATGRVSASLIGMALASWSFVIVLQALTGLALIASASTGRANPARSFDLWFVAQLPWDVWLILTAAWVTYSGELVAPAAAVASAMVPLLWTVALVHAYCRLVLGVSKAGAVWRVGLQQAMTWACIAAYIVLAAGGITGVTGGLARIIQTGR